MHRVFVMLDPDHILLLTATSFFLIPHPIRVLDGLKHYTSVVVFHYWKMAIMLFVLQTKATSIWPKSSSFISSDQITNFQHETSFSSLTLTYFTLAWTCLFFRSRAFFFSVCDLTRHSCAGI